MTTFDWHKDAITEETPVSATYRNTQNVRRFLTGVCGPDFKFDRQFMAWVTDGSAKTMGDVARAWVQRHGGGQAASGLAPPMAMRSS